MTPLKTLISSRSLNDHLYPTFFSYSILLFWCRQIFSFKDLICPYWSQKHLSKNRQLFFQSHSFARNFGFMLDEHLSTRHYLNSKYASASIVHSKRDIYYTTTTSAIVNVIVNIVWPYRVIRCWTSRICQFPGSVHVVPEVEHLIEVCPLRES